MKKVKGWQAMARCRVKQPKALGAYKAVENDADF
jgi:hypothetical protein